MTDWRDVAKEFQTKTEGKSHFVDIQLMAEEIIRLREEKVERNKWIQGQAYLLEKQKNKVCDLENELLMVREENASLIKALEESIDSYKGLVRSHYYQIGKEYLTEDALSKDKELINWERALSKAQTIVGSEK